jgi:chitin disaccharide deacetylase
MLIINADDWGRSKSETEAALSCFKEGKITSVSAMVFMEDSIRAAEIAKDHGIEVGLHLNFSQRFTGKGYSEVFSICHEPIVRFLSASKYSLLLYNPFLRQQFRRNYQTQLDEFIRLYDRYPLHINGHQHMHLCSNMLFDRLIDKGQNVRRSFSFFPGEKSFVNRTYRRFVDAMLARSYRLTDYFFSFYEEYKRDCLLRVFGLLSTKVVELMAHPALPHEQSALLGISTFRRSGP